MTTKDLNKQIKDLTNKMNKTVNQAEITALWQQREALKKQLRK